MSIRLGDCIRIVLTGRWLRGHPERNEVMDAHVIDVRRHWATVIFPCFEHWFALDVRFAALRQQPGKDYTIDKSNVRHPSWKRRHIWETACNEAEKNQGEGL